MDGGSLGASMDLDKMLGVTGSCLLESYKLPEVKEMDFFWQREPALQIPEEC